MSEEAKFQSTPGPWAARPEWQSSYGVPIYAEAVNERDEREHIGNAYLEADARLIAAAPELLGALRELLYACAEGDAQGDMSSYVDGSLMDAASDAIAKAEGREP